MSHTLPRFTIPDTTLGSDPSENFLTSGWDTLREWQTNQCVDRELLVKASQHFLRALQLNAERPEGHVALGYIMIVLDDSKMATRYLNKALEINPAHPDAQEFLDALHGEASPDQLYYRTNTQIKAQLRWVSQQPPPRPNSDFAQINTLEDTYTQLAENYEQLAEQVFTLDQEQDTSQLQQQLQLLEKQLRHYEKVCELSQKMMSLRYETYSEANRVAHLVTQLEQSSISREAAERELENILDICDRIADDLDSLSEQQISISQLEFYYNRLTAVVESLQDKLDQP